MVDGIGGYVYAHDQAKSQPATLIVRAGLGDCL
jgi:hypothetical protein